MATLLLIDDDPDLLRDRVSHVFPAPAHRVEIAQTGAEGLERVALSISPQETPKRVPPLARTSFSSTCVSPTSRASTS